MEWFGKNVLFIQKLIDMTLNKKISWKYYNDELFMFNDENFKFFHHEFCWIDSSNSFYSQIDNTIILLVYEISESGKDGAISSMYRLFIAEDGENGYIDDVPISEEQYALLCELSYHIKGILCKRNPKAERFIDNIIEGTNSD